VEWPFDVQGGRYARRIDPRTGKPVTSDDWAWSPQGVKDIHLPERWGRVQFSGIEAGAGTEAFVGDPNERVRWALRRLYYRQRRYRAENGRYAADLGALDAGNIRVEGLEFRPSMQATATQYEIGAPAFAGATAHIRQDGKAWISK
jgi:hypothetical protein